MMTKDILPYHVSKSKKDRTKWAVFKNGKETMHKYKTYESAVSRAQSMNRKFIK